MRLSFWGFLLMAVGLSLAGGVAMAAEPPPLSAGQTVYVPVYSQVQHGNRDRQGKPSVWLLSAMLSIRNTDPLRPLTVKSAVYYDSQGKKIRDFLTEPQRVPPLATIELFVEHQDQQGGSGANFLVSWVAEQPLNAPVIETVHTHFFGTQAVVFTSSGQPLRLEEAVTPAAAP